MKVMQILGALAVLVTLFLAALGLARYICSQDLTNLERENQELRSGLARAEAENVALKVALVAVRDACPTGPTPDMEAIQERLEEKLRQIRESPAPSQEGEGATTGDNAESSGES